MKIIAPPLGHHINLPAAEFSILGVKVRSQDAKLRNRIKVGNDGRSVVYVLFRIAAVHDEAVREFALPVDSDRSGIQVPGGRKRCSAYILNRQRCNRGDGSNA